MNLWKSRRPSAAYHSVPVVVAGLGVAGCHPERLVAEMLVAVQVVHLVEAALNVCFEFEVRAGHAVIVVSLR